MTATITNEDLAALANTPTMKQAREQAAADRLETRRAAVAEIARLERQIAAHNKQSHKAIDAARAKHEAAQAALRAAEGELNAALGAASNASADHRIAVLRKELTASAAPAITELVARIDAAAEAHRQNHPASGPAEPSRYRDDREKIARWAAEAWGEHNAKREALIAARAEAEALRLLALSDAELDAALARIGKVLND